MKWASMFLSTAAAMAALASDRVITEGGMLRGSVTPSYRAFLGIPFAAPPLANLRWAPPAPAKRWEGERDATHYRHNCLQSSNFDPRQPRTTISEDCLYLNVWTPPNATAASSLPVFVWVHGGSYQSGGANESRLNGTWDVRQGVIMVTTNYRLNIFGFLASDALRARDPEGGTGAYGILDQRASLRWVQANIRQFGGDPARVLLVGESAGGASVYNHLVRPRSYGLFSRAIAESGGYTLILPQPTHDEFERVYRTVLELSNCSAPACLEGVDADELLRVAANVQLRPGVVDFEPVVDGVDLTGQIAELVHKGHVAPHVPFMAGGTREDLCYPLWAAPHVQLECAPGRCTRDDFRDFVARVQPSFTGWSVDEMVEAYANAADEVALPGGNLTRWYWAAHHMGSDFCMLCPARRSVAAVAAAHSASSAAYAYLFAHAPDGPSGVYPHLAHHASEIPFVFDDESAVGPDAAAFHISRRERPLARTMAAAWAHFARVGSPPPWWPEYKQNGTWMLFGEEGGVRPQFKRARCDLWDRAVPARPMGVTGRTAAALALARR